MTVRTEADVTHLRRAIELAEQGRGRVSPNPLVGAVVVKDGEVVGEGWHAEYGAPHAEREALAAASGADVRGATMYVSLEPCCHEGKTPPCTEAIAEAGIGRVVVASDDPTEKASGRGLGILRDEGIEVDVADGEIAARARLLNQPFRKHARTGRPLGAVQVGDDPRRQGRDARAATRSGSRASRAARAPIGGGPSATRSPWGSDGAPRRPPAHRRAWRACTASRAASSSIPTAASPGAPSSCRRRPRSRSPSSCPAPPGASRPRRSRRRGPR